MLDGIIARLENNRRDPAVPLNGRSTDGHDVTTKQIDERNRQTEEQIDPHSRDAAPAETVAEAAAEGRSIPVVVRDVAGSHRVVRGGTPGSSDEELPGSDSGSTQQDWVAAQVAKKNAEKNAENAEDLEQPLPLLGPAGQKVLPGSASSVLQPSSVIIPGSDSSLLPGVTSPDARYVGDLAKDFQVRVLGVRTGAI